jgi:hypothetical protein
MIPSDDEDEEAYNRGELSALVRIQYEEREARMRAVTALGPHLGATKAQHAKQNQKRASNAAVQVVPKKGTGPNNTLVVTDKSRGWRNLKREIMEAVEERYHNNHSMTSSVSSPVYGHSTNSGTNLFKEFSHRRHHRSPSMGSEHDSIHSSSTPAYEQIAPPLHQAEVKVVEGALAMKTKCAWDVYTPLRRIFAVPYDLVLDRERIAEIYSEGYSRVPVYEKLPVSTVRGEARCPRLLYLFSCFADSLIVFVCCLVRRWFIFVRSLRMNIDYTPSEESLWFDSSS